MTTIRAQCPDCGDVQLKIDELTVRVCDDGAGLPPGFTMDTSTGLGLSIVRTLVESELNGSIDMRDGREDGFGTVVEVEVPLAPLVAVGDGRETTPEQ